MLINFIIPPHQNFLDPLLIAGICPNATSEYQTYVDEVNDALLRVSATKSTVLMGDFNAHVGTDTDTWKRMIGKHGVTVLNENGRYLLQLCHRELYKPRENTMLYDVTHE